MTSANVSVNLLNAILGYLANRPYQEVYQLVAAIQKEVVEGQLPKEDAEQKN